MHGRIFPMMIQCGWICGRMLIFQRKVVKRGSFTAKSQRAQILESEFFTDS